MKLKWKGKLSESNTFPKNYVPNNAIEFLNSNNKIEPYLSVIPIIILVIGSLYIKRNFVQEFNINIKGLIIGAVLLVPFIIIHEFLHALCFPKDCPTEIFYSPAGVSLIPCYAISKQRYITALLAPAIILGIIPLAIWTFIPFGNITINSIFFLVSIGNLGAASIDLYNLSQVIKKMPKNSYMITSEANCYYFTKQ